MPTTTKILNKQNNLERKSKTHNNRLMESNTRRLEQLLNKLNVDQPRNNGGVAKQHDAQLNRKRYVHEIG